MTPNRDNRKQEHDRNEAEIARGEREYRRAVLANEGDGFVPAHDPECCDCSECRIED